MNPLPEADHERLRDDLAAFALDALPAAEAEVLRAHLDGCESCQVQLRWLEPAIDVLPASVEQRTPPARLRESLLTVVREEAGHAAAEGHEGPMPERSARPERAPWWRALGGFALRPAGALAAIALLAAGIGGYAIGGDDDQPASGLASRYVDPEVPSAGLADAVSATLEVHGGGGTLHVQEMPTLDPDEVYEVWIDRDGVMEPASVFVLSRDGTAAAAVPGPLAGADAVLVTREPRGGSPQPTNPPLLRATLE